jgi:hypothetical protein
MTVGATPSSILGMVMRQRALMVAGGAVLGIGGALALARAEQPVVRRRINRSDQLRRRRRDHGCSDVRGVQPAGVARRTPRSDGCAAQRVTVSILHGFARRALTLLRKT